MRKKSKQTRHRKRSRSRSATPHEQLQAVVTVISGQGTQAPLNSLIGRTPHETIEACRRVVHWIATMTSNEAKVSIVDRSVLDNVRGALEHAAHDVKALWNSATHMVGSVQ
jgi:hypothetical protein